MIGRAGTPQRAALELARLLRPIAERLGNDRVLGTFAELGVQFPAALLTQPQISAARATVRGTTGALDPLMAQLITDMDGGDTTGMTAGALRVIEQCGRITASFDELTSALQTAGPTLPGISQQQVDDLVTGLPRKLMDLLMADVLERSASVGAVLQTLGVIVREPVLGDPADPTKPDHDRLTVRLDRLLPALGDPLGLVSSVYHWGDASFDVGALLRALEGALGRLGLPVLLRPASSSEPVELQAFALDIRPTTSGSPPGLAFEVVLPGSAGTSFDFQLSPPDWIAHVSLKGALPTGTTGTVRPPLRVELIPPGGGLDGAITVGLTVRPAQPVVVLGEPGGSRLEFGGLSAQAGITVASADGRTSALLSAEGEITDGKLVIDLGAGDGFLRSVVGGGRVEAGFGIGFTFDPATGMRFHGSGSLDIRIPVHLRVGPVDVHAVNLAVKPGPVMPVELSTAFTAALGPIQAAVERVGVIATLGFPSGGGNLGPAQLDFAFKPPDGVGLSIDVAMLKGGGFLYADPGRGEYAGTLALRLAGFIDVKAIGLISTRMPDGTPGFSLLLVLTAEFGGIGLQLGYGFTLLAVGGLLGLHRSMNLAALTEGVRTGAIESVMFPKDVVANAPRILSDLRAFFPPREGTFLIGPMAKIGWGTPTLVSVSLGVIIEIPGNIAIVGILRCVLPSQELPLLVLQVNFVGAIEFDKQRLWFYAQLFESRILMMTIEGGMGLLVGWGGGDLVLSVGGFHPSFRPPPLPFPVPPRIAVDIIHQPFALIRLSGYFAVTSNTVQFGAHAELVLGFDDFGLQGHLSFDALFRFSPFAFTIDIAADLTLKAFGVGLFGIHLRFQLEGPAPWRAHGRGSISLLFFEISADFDLTWGDSKNPTLPPVDVLSLLSDEIGKLEGWRTELPTGGSQTLVNLRTLPPSDGLVLHPLGTLFVRQRVIPLGVRLDRVGSQRPLAGHRFSVAPAPDSGLVQLSRTTDRFAMAQFQDMDDAAKLSRPAYEGQDAGLELAPVQGALTSARAARRSARYEMIVIDSRRRPAALRTDGGARIQDPPAAASAKRLYTVSPAVFRQLLGGSSTSRSALSRHEATLRQPFADDTLRVTGQRYVVAHRRNNQRAFSPGTLAPLAAAQAGFLSHAAAADALAAMEAADPRRQGTLHVIPESETAGVPAAPGGWTSAASVPSAFAAADAAVLLQTGRVLLAGGTDETGGARADSLLFDPVTGIWTQADRLRTGRHRHGVVRLGSGGALAVGGLGADGSALKSAETYDPVAGTWSTLPAAMSTARYGHSVTPLASSKVLVAGGTGLRGREPIALASAELFDPAVGTWSTAKPMTDARTGHQAVVLKNGHVLVVGGVVAIGRARSAALAYCELFDPTTGTWMPTGSLSTPRVGHQATLLPDGRVLVTGGDTLTGRPRGRYHAGSLATAEIYDPVSGQWTTVSPMSGGRSRHRAALLATGKVLVLGGTSGPGYHAGYRSTVTYDPSKDTWTPTGGLATGRSDFIALPLADGRVLTTGGRVIAGPAAPDSTDVLTATAEIFTP